MSACDLIYLRGVHPLTSSQELDEIIAPLPVGCSLLVSSSLIQVRFPIFLCYVCQAIFDASHSGTLLDLPHHHCNSVYVPWQSKGERRTMTMHNKNGLPLHHTTLSYSDVRLVRHQASVFADIPTSGDPLSITDMKEGQRADRPSGGPSRIDTQLGERGPADQSQLSRGAQSFETRRPQERMLSESMPISGSPEPAFHCDGWCEYSGVPHPNIVSIERHS